MRIALIGSAPASVGRGPYRDAAFQRFIDARPVLEMSHIPFASDQWEIWGCSPGVYGVAERMTRWFELHRWEPGQAWFSPEYCDFLRAFRGPLYTTEVIPELKSSVRLPRERIVQEFGPYFLTSSLSFMFAMAILAIEDRRTSGRDDVEDQIGLWGVDMAATEEYGYQRAGCQFFMREAQRRGIAVVLPPESDLHRPMPMYGVAEWTHAHVKALARWRELDQRKKSAEQQAAAASAQVQFLAGAMDNMDYMIKTWLVNDHSAMVTVDEHGKQVMYLPPLQAPATSGTPTSPGGEQSRRDAGQ